MAEYWTTKLALSTLKDNRHMQTNEEFHAFEDALTFLAAHPDPNDLPSLHLALDDDCDQYEVMFGLVHFIEDFDLDTQLRTFLEVMPELVIQAPRWTRTLTVRILNNEESRIHYKRFFQSAASAEKSAARNVLEKIVASKKTPLENKARFVLEN